MKDIIKTSNLSKFYERGRETVKALVEANISIGQGEMVSVMGPSGSGKSTLMNLLGCLDTPTSGSYKLGDQELFGLKERDLVRIRQEKLGFVFQQFFLLPTLTVKENVELPLLFKNKGKNRSKELLEMVGLTHRLNHLPKELSGGEMQRVAVARSLINSPEILLADEPTGNLDTKNSETILDLLRELNKQGITIIMVTHNPDIAKVACRTIFLSDGRIANT